MSTTTVSSIPTLTHLYKTSQLPAAFSTDCVPGTTSKYNDKISLIRTDITKLATDAIVNAANESLLGGGGVDGAIHNAAGPDLLRECRTLDGCDTGSAKITNAYRLPSKKIIHAVGPVYSSSRRERSAHLLASCYTTSLSLAVENGCESIAFPALSTGIFGYPSEDACQTAIAAVKGWLDEDEERAGKLERVVFCSFLQKDETAYEKHVPRFFPPAEAEQDTTSKSEETTAASKNENVKPEVTEDAEAAKDDKTGDLPELPDVPTAEPKLEDGQPERKKAKMSSDEVEPVQGEESAKELVGNGV